MERRQEEERRTTHGRPPQIVNMMATTMKQLLNHPPATAQPDEPSLNVLAATDAGANDTSATVAGWYSHQNYPQKHEVHWFYIIIDQTDHPWAFKGGTPQQHIAALELYGTLILLKHIAQKHHATTNITIPLLRDNQGNTYNVADYRSKH